MKNAEESAAALVVSPLRTIGMYRSARFHVGESPICHNLLRWLVKCRASGFKLYDFGIAGGNGHRPDIRIRP